jgi:hypothetical protein
MFSHKHEGLPLTVAMWVVRYIAPTIGSAPAVRCQRSRRFGGDTVEIELNHTLDQEIDLKEGDAVWLYITKEIIEVRTEVYPRSKTQMSRTWFAEEWRKLTPEQADVWEGICDPHAHEDREQICERREPMERLAGESALAFL